MKLLWVYSDFLHPTTRGGQIRTLETLKRLHARHEVHYAALWNPRNTEGPARAAEYASRVYKVRHVTPDKRSPVFLPQLLQGLFASMPVAVFRYHSKGMREMVEGLRRKEAFDAVVCDFLSSAPHFTDLSDVVLFQHNVEAIIWQRHAENAPTPFHRQYFQLQAKRMLAYERKITNAVKNVIAVSDADARNMRELYGVKRVAAVPTGVDVSYFTPPVASEPTTDLVFVGSMDWMPNADGILWFAREVLPLIRAKQPGVTLAVVGRNPGKEVTSLAEQDAGIRVTGTVDDVRPWLWGAKAAIVPLRIGGGTRLKIYEAMAARTAVVSTTIGAEGLEVSPEEDIVIADAPAAFADACVRLISDGGERQRIAAAAWEHVAARHSWEAAATAFERLLGH